MPNPVAYNYTNTLANNLLKPGYTTVCIGLTGPNEPNYSAGYSSLTWRNGFDTSSGSYWTLYSNDYSQGVQPTQASGLPVGWVTAAFDSDLLDLINKIPERSQQSPFEDLSSAVSWALGTGHYLIQNREYPPIAFSSAYPMLAGYDPATTICYPRVNDDLYDISGNASAAAVKAGVTVEQDSQPFKFTFSGGSITLPIGLASTITTANNKAFSFSAVINTNSVSGSDYTIFQITTSEGNWIKFYIDGTAETISASGNLNDSNAFSGVSLGWSPIATLDYHIGIIVYQKNGTDFNAQLYVNGSPQGSVATLVTSPSPANFVEPSPQRESYIGSSDASADYWDGYIGPVHIFRGNIGSDNMYTLAQSLKAAYGYTY
jgi:hypothetical protein